MPIIESSVNDRFAAHLRAQGLDAVAEHSLSHSDPAATRKRHQVDVLLDTDQGAIALEA